MPEYYELGMRWQEACDHRIKEWIWSMDNYNIRIALSDDALELAVIAECDILTHERQLHWNAMHGDAAHVVDAHGLIGSEAYHLVVIVGEILAQKTRYALYASQVWVIVF